MSSVAKNLAVIVKAIDSHSQDCPFPPTAVALSPFEVDRLGWDEIQGLPIIEDPQLSSGIFRIICDRDQMVSKLVASEARESQLTH